MAEEADHQPDWVHPSGTHTQTIPPERPARDLRWRQQPPAEFFGEPKDQQERSWRAVAGQCLNSRIPGYTGFIPSSHAEDVYGCTAAAAGRSSAYEQSRRRAQQEEARFQKAQSLPPSHPVMDSTILPGEAGFTMPEDHPLGKSKANITRSHWVPTIPGYSGFIPAKQAENICGGGIMASAQLARRAIEERKPLPAAPSPVTMQDDVSRSRIGEFYHTENQKRSTEDRVRLAGHYRDHCSKQIPGYSGHIPRKAGETICGATYRNANLIAADICEDKLFSPQDHFTAACAPQFPQPRKLRM